MGLRLSVVVPATDQPPTLSRCLAALQASTWPADEVVVVADAALRSPAAARNAGVARTSGDLVAFVDADIVVRHDALDRLRRAFASNPSLVAVFGAYDDGVGLGTVADFRNLLHRLVHVRSAGAAQTFWAGIGAVRRTDFDAVGGFDEARYRQASIEDLELGTRLAARGSILLEPEITGTHLKRWTLVTMVRTDFARRGLPWMRLSLERRSLPATLNLGQRERASAGAAALTAWGLIGRRPSHVALGIAAQCALNRDLYRLLARRLGVRGAAAGVALHLVHQWTALATVPVALAAHAARVTRLPREAPRRGTPPRAGLPPRCTPPRR